MGRLGASAPRFATRRALSSDSRLVSASPFPKHDTARYDRHGIPRCAHCGGPTDFLRFSHQPSPRIWFRCHCHPHAVCLGDQSIACSTDWRALVPLRRDDAAYLELRRSHKTFEAVHDYWRDRYKVAAADIGQRPKRTGLEWQQLRANAAS